MVKLAREMVAKGELGEIIKVVCEYPQGYAITALTGEEKAIANWRPTQNRRRLQLHG